MGLNNHYTAAEFINAIPGSGGIISTIAKRVGCAWHTAKKYCTTYPTVAKVYGDEVEKVGDLAESILLDNLRMAREHQVNKKKPTDTSDAKWYLTMKAKDRGYAQKYEIDALVRNLDLSKMSDSQLDRLATGEGLIDVLATPGTG